MTTTCATCGMPLEKKEDIGLTNEGMSFCKYCVDTDGTVKRGDQIFEGGVLFFLNAVPGTPRELAERLTRKNMRSLQYWKGKNEQFLEGLEATDEEFAEAMKKIG